MPDFESALARTWIQRLGGHRRTRRFISLGSPQQGTITAQPWPGQIFRGLADLKWDSALLRELNSNSELLESVDCHSFYSALDLNEFFPCFLVSENS